MSRRTGAVLNQVPTEPARFPEANGSALPPAKASPGKCECGHSTWLHRASGRGPNTGRCIRVGCPCAAARPLCGRCAKSEGAHTDGGCSYTSPAEMAADRRELRQALEGAG